MRYLNRNYLFLLGCYLTFFVLAAGCLDFSEQRKSSIHKPNLLKYDSVKTITKIDSILRYRFNRKITYASYPIKGIKTVHILDSLYGEDGRTLILTLNRLDSYNLRRGDSLVIPDTLANLISYCPFPFLIDKLKLIPKIVFVSRRIQAFACYENGILLRWGPTSTGRKSKPTPEGLFHTNWKSKKTISTINEEWVLPFYFNIVNNEGVAFHHFSLPGYPASHACIRLLENDAEWFFHWAEQWIVTKDGEKIRAYGTPVLIFGDYKYGTPPPWKRLTIDPDAQSISTTEIDSLLEKYLSVIKERYNDRELVLVSLKQEKAKRDSINLSMK